MNVIAEIQASLNRIAPTLFNESRTDATRTVHHALEELASRYADDAGLAFGKHEKADVNSKNQDSNKRIQVYSSVDAIRRERDTQGAFLFDLCWLVYYNSNDQEHEGRLFGCELAMECEWSDDAGSDNKEYRFLQDLRKLMVAKARTKVFIFRSNTKSAQDATMKKLISQIESFATDNSAASTYLLCSWHMGEFFYETISA